MYEPTPVQYQPKHAGRVKATTCKHCGSTSWGICKLLNGTGAATFPWYCMECNRRTTLYEPKHEHIVHTAVFDDRGPNECQYCGCIGAEAHHIMPCHLVGPGEADKWPIVYLCQKHHAQWHQTVTPNMSCKD
jgi:hypothetical protein